MGQPFTEVQPQACRNYLLQMTEHCTSSYSIQLQEYWSQTWDKHLLKYNLRLVIPKQ